MIVIAKDAEFKFSQDLYALRCFHSCYFLEFSKLGMPLKGVLRRFLDALHGLPESYAAQVYFCRDGDVFILMNGFMVRHFKALLTRFFDDLGRAMDGFGAVYDCQEDRAFLKHMVTSKLIVLDKVTSLPKVNLAMVAATDALSMVGSADLISLKERRGSRSGKPVVMLVDDDPLSCVLVRNSLKDAFEFVYVSDGMEAVKRYAKIAPDIVFLDIGLPDISGHDVLECIFQIDAMAHVIMLSGSKDEGDMLFALQKGAQGFVSKPFTRDILFDHVQKSPLTERRRENCVMC